MKKLLLATTALMITQGAVAAPGELPSREEMWEMIQTQQKQIEALTSKVGGAEQKAALAEQKADATQQAVEENIASLETFSGGNGFPGWFNDTTIGGYGELHMNKGSTKDEVDAHRFVLFVGHEFDEDTRLFAEIEVEHADEIFLEQAYIEFDLNDYNQAKVGAFLIPVGIINENHEPTTFFGVERNPIETNIIPTTWREAGVMFSGELGDGFSYDIGVHSGLDSNLKTPSSYKPRDGRGKISQASAESGSATGRIKYTGIAGLELATTVNYQQDISQNVDATEADGVLIEAHADYRDGPFGLRALYAQWDIDGAGAAALGQDEQYGFYVEPSYRFPLFEESEGGVFARYNMYDNAAGNNVDSDIQQIDFGFNFWPHPDVVLKTDMAIIRSDISPDDEIFNLGVGFVF